MKLTKDNVNSQSSDATIQNVVDVLATCGITHISIAIPINSNQQFIDEGTTPSPRTIEALYQKWCDTIHNAGLKVLHRGTLCGLEGIWSFTQQVGAERIEAGDSSSTDATTHLGKIYQWLTTNAMACVSTGDILAFCPERTEGVFSDSTCFLPSTAPGLQTRFTNFYANMKTICDERLSTLGITGVVTGYTANNWTEVSSGWLQSAVFSGPNIVSFDHYGTDHSPEEMEDDLNATYNAKSRAMFHQEWGNQETFLSVEDKLNYLKRMWDMESTFADNVKLKGYNYWGGWAGNAESILTGSAPNYTLNAYGKMLATFFKQGSCSRLPVTTGGTGSNFLAATF